MKKAAVVFIVVGLLFLVGCDGDTGPAGLTGPAMDFDKLTKDQKGELTGAPGKDGAALTYAMLTPLQKESLRGETLVFDNLTDAQKAALKGNPGANVDPESCTADPDTGVITC